MEQMDLLAKWITIIEKPDRNPCSRLIPAETRARIRRVHSECVQAIATALVRSRPADDPSSAIVEVTAGLYNEVLELERAPLVTVATRLYEHHPNLPREQETAMLELANHFHPGADHPMTSPSPSSPSQTRGKKRPNADLVNVACASIRRACTVGWKGWALTPPTVKWGMVFGLPGAVAYQAARFDGITPSSAVSTLVCAGAVSWGLVVNPSLYELIRDWDAFLQSDLGWDDLLTNRSHLYAVYQMLWSLFPVRQLSEDLRFLGKHLLIPGFHAFALAVKGMVDVYEAGGSVMHYLWFDLALSHISRLYLFSHAFLQASWDKIDEYMTILRQKTAEATEWVVRKGTDALRVVTRSLGDGLLHTKKALLDLVGKRVDDADREQIERDAEDIQEHLAEYEETGLFQRELSFDETVELARRRRAPSADLGLPPPTRPWWKHFASALIPRHGTLRLDEPSTAMVQQGGGRSRAPQTRAKCSRPTSRARARDRPS